MAKAPKSSLLSISRIWTIATGTFTQLVRMKVFYFLAVFALLIIGIHFIELPYTVGPESIAHEKLRMIKGPSFGAMTLFAIIFSIASTALLIPRDLEERTLYTILSKPVPRLDYLLGKLIGVILVIAVSLLVMDGLMCLMLWIKTQQVTADIVTRAKGSSWSPEMLEVALSDVKRHGLNTSLQAGVLSVFLLSVVIAAIALLISTFSSSTLFTIIMTLLVYVIGLIAGGVTEYWESDADGNTALVLLGKAIGLVLPNFKLFNLFDGAINGHFISGTIVLKLTITAFIYTLIYTILSWFVFQDKEF